MVIFQLAISHYQRVSHRVPPKSRVSQVKEGAALHQCHRSGQRGDGVQAVPGWTGEVLREQDPPVIKHGVLENEPSINDFPS